MLSIMTDGNETYCSDNYVMYINNEFLWCTPKTSINHTSIKINNKKLITAFFKTTIYNGKTFRYKYNKICAKYVC